MIFNNEGTSVATQYYAGMTSASSDVMRLGSGNALLKFGTNGLMQSLNGGSNYAAAAPRLYSVVYDSSKTSYTATGRNCASGSVIRRSAGKLVLTHGLNSTKYITFLQAKTTGSTSWSTFAKVIAQAAKTVTINIIDRDGNFRDDDCDVAIFPYA